MRKIAALALAVLLALTLAACAGGDGAAGGGDAAPSQSDGNGSQTPDDPQTPSGSQAPDESQLPDDSQTPDASGASSDTEDADGQPGGTQDPVPSVPDDTPDSASDDGPAGGKILVAYFSATNNTEGVAQKLADGLGADLYEITPEQPYTAEDLAYGDPGSRSSMEMDDPSARPAIAGAVEDMSQYDVVLIGYPIWWGEAPRIMSTFVESYDFSGKTLAAFCTSASSGFGSSDAALRAAASGATWLEGRRFPAGAAAEDVMAWADGLGIG